MDTKQFMERVKELEITERKYIQLKEFVSTEVRSIYEHLNEIEIILKKISPQLSLSSISTRNGRKNSDSSEEKTLELSKIYSELAEEKLFQISNDEIAQRLNLSNVSGLYAKYLPIFKKLPGINVRKDGKTNVWFYIKTKDTTELKDYFPKEIVENIKN